MDQENTHEILPENTIPAKSNKALKVLVLGILTCLFFVIDWWLIKVALYGSKDLIFWIWPAVASSLAIVFLTFFSLTNANRWYAAGVSLLVLLPYIYLFPKNIYVLLGGLGFLFLMIWFEQRIRSEEKARHDFSIRRTSAASIGMIIYAFLLLLGLNIYHNTSADFKKDPESFYDSLGRSAARSARYVSGESRTGINLDQPLDKFLETEARQQFPEYNSLTTNQRKQLLDEAKQQFFRQFNVQVSENKPLSEVMAQYAIDRVRHAASGFQPLFPLIFTIIILGLLRSFAFVFRWITLGLTWVLFRILLRLRFFRLTKVPIEVEKLEI